MGLVVHGVTEDSKSILVLLNVAIPTNPGFSQSCTEEVEKGFGCKSVV